MGWHKVHLNSSSFRNGRQPHCKICDAELEKGKEVMAKDSHSRTHYYCEPCYDKLWI